MSASRTDTLPGNFTNWWPCILAVTPCFVSVRGPTTYTHCLLQGVSDFAGDLENNPLLMQG